MMTKKNSRSFSLIEVLVFISILSLFFVVAATVTTTSLRNMKISEHKILATRYAEELLEWLRGEKEVDWNQFVTLRSNRTYCFKDSPITSWSTIQSTCSNTQLLDSLFKREVKLTNVGNPVSQVNVSITVSWQEAGDVLYSLPLNTVFSIWEQ